MARRTRRPTFSELPATEIVRNAAGEGVDPAALARALYVVSRQALSRASGELYFEPAEQPEPRMLRLAENAIALFPVSLTEGISGSLNPEWLEEFHRLSRPDADHKRHGRWYTSRPIARYMARRAIVTLTRDQLVETIDTLDPACGCGSLLVPIFEEIVAFRQTRSPRADARDIVTETLQHLYAADVDAEALDTAMFRLRLAAHRLAGEATVFSPIGYLGDALCEQERVVPQAVDLVVMNPPYLGNRYFDALEHPEQARKRLRDTFGWNDDLYTHFLAAAWDWLRPGGVMCAITSDTFLTIQSKARTRDTLRAHALREITRVSPAAFAAAVNTCITVAVNAPPELFDTLVYQDARAADEKAWDRMDEDPPPPGVERFLAPGQVYAYPDIPFYRPTPRATAIYERFWRKPSGVTGPGSYVPLGQVAPARDCGINSGNVRYRLFFLDGRPGLKRLIQGRQLERYIVRWDSPSAKFRWVDVDYVPDRDRPGIGRGGRTSRAGETWGFRGGWEIHHETVRLFLRQTEDDLFAALHRQEPGDPLYTDNTVFTVLMGEEGVRLGLSYEYLLGLLNSGFLNELYHQLSQEEGRAQAQVKVGYVNRLPILIPSPEQKAEVEAYVLEAMAAQTEKRDLEPIQRRLDALVAEMYDVSSLPPASCSTRSPAES